MSQHGTSLLQRRLASSTAILADVRALVADAARAAGFSDRDAFRLALAVDEACTNIIVHGYDEDDSATFDLDVAMDNEGLTVTLRDVGRPFSGEIPTSIDVAALMQQRKKGGLGLFLIGQVIDHVAYSTDKAGTNQLRLLKRRP